MNRFFYGMTMVTLLSQTVVFAADTPADSLPTAPVNQTGTPPAANQQGSSSILPPPQPTAVIDCHYRIPLQTTNIDTSIIQTWAERATIQSFDFNPATMDDQLTSLKACYTDQGWQGFSDALQKSGNIDAIKSQHLTVSSEVVGDVSVTPMKDHQWKVSVPMQVVYQNDKEKLTQMLMVNLLVGRKQNGDLGIMQMIATPQTAPTDQAGTPAAATTDTSPADTTSAPSVTIPTQGADGSSVQVQ